MKLKNKKTGKMIDLTEGFIRDTYNGSMIQIKPVAISNEEGYVYSSLAELIEEWEDYEEPKEYWYINPVGKIYPTNDDLEGTKESKEIGNYFETQEEAEKAVEKLKAWKRLKDKGFRFNNWDLDADDEDVNVLLSSDSYKGNKVYDFAKDLDLLFGGEE